MASEVVVRMSVAYIVLGLCAYPALALFEYASWRKMAVLKAAMGIAAVVLPSVSLAAMCMRGERFALPGPLSSVGWLLALCAAGLWLYSMFWEIPFAKTYLGAGHGDVLVTHGTYALTRHPTVLWLGALLLGLVLGTRSFCLLVAAPLWWLADVLYVWAEEKWYLRRVFPGYAAYQRTTPMLLPTVGSLKRCLRTVMHQKGHPGV